MKNKHLDEKTAADIDKQIDKLLRGLGNPEPPLDLNQARELLRLDRQYYSTTDDGPLLEFVSRIQVAGKQFIEQPTRIIDVVRRYGIKALFIPQGNRILIDSSEPKPKWRWNEAHETIHSIIPWHDHLLHGDTLQTLNPACHEQIEGEANYGAGRLLFLQGKFENFIRDSPLAFSTVQAAHKHFGNTLTSSLWRMVEHLDIPAVGVVCQHPRHTNEQFDPEVPCRYFIVSRSFQERFSEITENHVFNMICSYCSYKKGGPLGKEEIILTDDGGMDHVFLFETFDNRYDALTLVTYVKAHNPIFPVQVP